jgi:hypothetical protein
MSDLPRHHEGLPPGYEWWDELLPHLIAEAELTDAENHQAELEDQAHRQRDDDR